MQTHATPRANATRARTALVVAAALAALAAPGCRRRHHHRAPQPEFAPTTVAQRPFVPPPAPYDPYAAPPLGLAVPAPIATAPDTQQPIPPPGVMRQYINNGT